MFAERTSFASMDNNNDSAVLVFRHISADPRVKQTKLEEAMEDIFNVSNEHYPPLTCRASENAFSEKAITLTLS